MRTIWQKWVALALVIIMTIQIPISVFADDILAEEKEWELLLDDTAELMEDDNILNEDIVEWDTEAYEDSDYWIENNDSWPDETIIEEETEGTFPNEWSEDEIIVEDWAEEIDENAKESAPFAADIDEYIEEMTEITVTVSISRFGHFLDDKNGIPMAGREIVLTGKASYTMDDAVRMAHELYYTQGVEGYDYHEDPKGVFDGVIYRLWGYDCEDIYGIGYALNHEDRYYTTALSREIQNEDNIHIFIKQQKGIDKYAFFSESSRTVFEDQEVSLQLLQFDQTTLKFSGCAGATIYIDNVAQADCITDSEGKVVLPKLETREEPYFITAGKSSSGSGNNTAISACYAFVTVVSGSDTLPQYIESLTLHTISYEGEGEFPVEITDTMKEVIIPSEMVYGASWLRADMYVQAKLIDIANDELEVFAIYTDPKSGAIHRTKLKEGTDTYLPYAIAKGAVLGSMINCNLAIDSLKLEVRDAGRPVEVKEIPIRYKNHLCDLIISDSWGQDLSFEFGNTTDDQEITLYAPENAEFLNIAADAYGYYEGVDITVDDAITTVDFSNLQLTNRIRANGNVKRFYPDWTAHDEYTAYISIRDTDKVASIEPAEYIIHIKKGENAYVPEVSINEEAAGTYFLNTDPVMLKVQADVERANEGKFSYQWYYIEQVEESYYPPSFKKNQYHLIDGAEDSVYFVPTNECTNAKGFCCKVTFTIEGRSFVTWSSFVSIYIYPEQVDTPVITTQPKDFEWNKGQTAVTPLRVELGDTPWFYLKPYYQWYKNTIADSNSATLIENATSSTYYPGTYEEGETYYFCKVWFARFEYKDGQNGGYVSGEGVFSDAARVIVKVDYPWEGEGIPNKPFQLSTITDLEALRDMVNQEGADFDGMYFQMVADISLPSDWIPIGSIRKGYTSTGNGKNLWPFSGRFDGGGHTLTIEPGGRPLFNYVRETFIENLKIYGEQIKGYGLIDGYTVDYGSDAKYDSGVPTTATIKNVTLLSGTSTLYAGLIGGYASGYNYVHIENCIAEKGVIIGYGKQESSIGTFAGLFNGTVRGCRSEADVYGVHKVGGLVGGKGQSMSKCIIENSTFAGNVNASGNWAGGILGSGYEADSAPNTPVATIRNCLVTGNVTGASNVGGIFGGEPSCKECWGNGAGEVTNNAFYGTVSGRSNVGGIIGYLRSFDKFQAISNNYYLDTCGAAQGIGGIGEILTVANNPTYGIDYEFNQADYCFAKSAAEFADGTVRAGLNSGSYTNWAQGEWYPVHGEGAYPIGLSVTDYKEQFYLGERFDLDGATITVTWSDGSTTNPAADEIEVIGYDNQTRGAQMVQLKYGAVSTDISIAVLKRANQIAVTFSLYGDTEHDSDRDGTVHTLTEGNLIPWIENQKYYVDANATVWDVIVLAQEQYQFEVEQEFNEQFKTIYVQGIKFGDIDITEFSNGPNSGWMYRVNGFHADIGVSAYYLEDGDEIVMHYTDDYTQEHDWVSEWSFDEKAHWHECINNMVYCSLENEEKGSYGLHTFDGGVVTRAATASAEGERVYTCSVCGYRKKESIPKTAAPVKETEAVDPRGSAGDASTVLGMETVIISQAADKDVSGADYLTLRAKVKSVTKKSAKLSWKKVSGAEGYIVYGGPVKKMMVNLTETTGTSFIHSGLKKGSYYKYAVVAYRTENGVQKVIAVSKNLYAATKGGKVTNDKALKSTKKKVTLKKKKTFSWKVKEKKAWSGKVKKFRKISYESSNKAVATVSAKGKIKAVGKGTCYVYAYAQNGVMARIKVMVKK